MAPTNERSIPKLSFYRPYESAKLLLFHSHYWWHLAVLIIASDAALTQLIIRFVRYTEIDYETYMEQVALYDSGIRDYALLKGPTGPLVYPVGHVYIHQILRWLTTTPDGTIRVRLAQQIYATLYLVTLTLACWIYNLAGGMPNYIMIFLVLSKRLHSIYVLRLFNDCWAVVAVMASIVAFNKRKPILGSLLFSAALSVKMNILLYLPGLLVVLVQSAGLWKTVQCLTVIGAFQLAIALPLLSTYPNSYLANAFDLGRVFLYKWTVNWRFISEEKFLSKELALVLLAGHLLTLIAFGFRWCQPDGLVNTIQRAMQAPLLPAAYSRWVRQDRLTTILFTSNLVGIIFARSLHYQFYCWYALQLPFLMWRTIYPVPVKIVFMLAIEYCWNIYPSTIASSQLLFSCHMFLLWGIYLGDANGIVPTPIAKENADREKGL